MKLGFMLVLIIALPIEVSSAQNNQDPNLVEITYELNELVYRYDLAGGWFSETDTAKLILTRLAMAHGDFGLPKPFGSKEGRYNAIVAKVPPKNKKWVYWNNSTRRFQIWRGKAPHQVQIVTSITRNFSPVVAVTNNDEARKNATGLKD